MAVITTKQANGSFADQVFDEVVGSARKWFTLQGNILDGTFHPIPANGSEQVGFIGAYPADANGIIQRPALNFDGINSRVSIAHSASLNVDTDFTVEVVCESIRDASWSIISKTDKYFATGTPGWHLSTASTPSDLLFEIQNGTSRAYARFNVGRVFGLSHFAAVRSASTILTYTNGLYQATATLSGSVSNTLDVLIGALGSSYFFQGIVKEVRIWNYARTQAEIQRDMNKPLKGDEPGLIGYWTMDEGSGSVVYDKTVNANHGTIYGATWTQAAGASVVRWKLDTPCSAHKLRVHGDTQRNIYPVDFDIQLYDAGANKLLERQVRGNTQVQWFEDLPSVYDFTAMDVTVYKMSAASPVVLTEASNEFSVARKDTLLPKAVDAVVLAGVGVWSTDALLPKLTDSKLSTTVSTVRADTLLLKTTDSSFFRQYEFRKTDTLLPKTSEAKSITAQLTRGDTLLPKTGEQKTITGLLHKGDNVVVKSAVEEDIITASFSSTDALAPLLVEDPTLTNVHTRMDEDARTVVGKVEITYTDPFMDETIQVTADGSAYPTRPEEVADNINTAAQRWFALHDNKLDGTYRLIPGNREYSVGWWSSALSNADGVLSPAATLTVTFSPRLITHLQVCGDDKAGNYPVDFTISLYDVNNMLLYTETVVGNNLVSWYKDINDVAGVAKMVLSITKISKPNQPAKILEFYTAVVEIYDVDRVESIQLLEELEYQTGGITLGAVSSNEIEISLDNSDKRFSVDNPQSPLRGLLKRNRRVRAWLGVDVIPGVTEWHPLGVFWTIEWRAPSSSVSASLVARDRLDLLLLSDFNTSQVYTNYSLHDLFQLVLLDAGLKSEEFYIDSALSAIVIPYAWFERTTHREALQRLASCDTIQVYCNREGLVVVEKAVPSPTVIYAFDDDRNLYDKDFPFAWSGIANYVEVQAVTWKPGNAQTVVDDSQVFSVPAGGEVTRIYKFTSVPAVNVQAPAIAAGPDVTVKSYTVYAWGILITFQNTGAASENVTQVSVTASPLEQANTTVAIAKDDEAIRQEGKIVTTIQHDFIQDFVRAQALADTLLASYKQARHDVTLDTRGNIGLRLTHRVTAPSEFGAASDYMVVRQIISWDGALGAKVEAKKII